MLYVSPVVPGVTGNGLAMRAGSVLTALADRYDISLLAVPLYASRDRAVAPEVGVRCNEIVVLPPTRIRPASRPASDFEVIHVFRLAAVPFARRWLATHGWTGADSSRPEWHLDLDDVESVTRRAIARLYAMNGHVERARLETIEADRHARLEAAALRHFDRVYVCSEEDRRYLQRNGGTRVCVMPNVTRPPTTEWATSDGVPFTFLFVGTLGYYPNEDAVTYFCREIVPLVRSMATGAFRVEIVGGGASPAIRAAASQSDSHLLGALPDVARCYAGAGAVIAPIRAGGGTRIKIIEAFSYRRPLVTTSAGIAGIEARGGEHALVADTAPAFAAACVRLMQDNQLADALAERAFDLYLRKYTPQVLSSLIAARA
jgi:polysaccharide biosynthesis protein PslH